MEVVNSRRGGSSLPLRPQVGPTKLGVRPTVRKRPSMASKKKNESDIVQVKNPRSGKYVKIDRAEGKILDHKKSEGPYKNVPVARKKSGGR